MVVLSDWKKEKQDFSRFLKFETGAKHGIARDKLLITFSPRNNWKVKIARTRQTTEMMQPMYVMICNATWWAMSNLTAWTSIRTAKFVRWLHSHTVWVSLVFRISQPSSDQALKIKNINCLLTSCFLFQWDDVITHGKTRVMKEKLFLITLRCNPRTHKSDW